MKSRALIHPQALVESDRIGKHTRVGAFVHILPGAVIGSECDICDNVYIETDVVIGNRVTIKNGVQLWDGVKIEDDVFIGPGASFTNDYFPRSRQQQDEVPRTRVNSGASIGANATLLPGITIGKNAMVGAGTVVTHDVPQNAIVVGNPARITGYVSTTHSGDKSSVELLNRSNIREQFKPKVKGVQFLQLPEITDIRGKLSFAEFGQELPFIPKRYFLIYDVPNRKVRGEHAHKELHEFLICVKGTCSVMVDDGYEREEYLLDSPNLGFHIPPMVWGVQYKYSEDAVLVVLASDVYDADDYIRDYDEFLSLVTR